MSEESVLPPWVREMRIIGADLSDEVFTHQSFGSFNVDRMWKAILSGDLRGVERITSPITKQIVAVNAGVDCSEEVIAAMTPERGDLPLILQMCPDGTSIFVDGNNRLRWRIRQGLPDFRAFMFPVWRLGEFHVQIEGRGETGPWRAIDDPETLKRTYGKHSTPERDAEIVAQGIKDGLITYG